MDGGVKKNERDRWDIAFDVSLFVLRTIAILLVGAFIVALVLMLVYAEDASDTERAEHRQRNIHFDEVQLAMERVNGSGLAWYEVMDVPGDCLVHEVIHWEIKHGLRPPHSVDTVDSVG